jgi:hypothetical protein
LPEWSAYAKAIKHCVSLDVVHHGTHVADARRIIEDGMIEARLVYDESLLNQTRTCVTWFSPNVWVDGSRYGTVQFSFAWPPLLGNRNIFWVEVIKKYQPHACRFLLTKRKLHKQNKLKPYDAETERGPLRLRDGKWYRNPDVTLEFMLDEDADISKCHEVTVVKHHPTYCSQSGNCGRPSAEKTAAMIMAHILARGSWQVDEALVYRSGPNKGKPNFAAELGLGAIREYLVGSADTCAGSSVDQVAMTLVRSALLHLSIGRENDARTLIHLLKTVDEFDDALRKLARRRFDKSEFKLPWD